MNPFWWTNFGWSFFFVCGRVYRRQPDVPTCWNGGLPFFFCFHRLHWIFITGSPCRGPPFFLSLSILFCWFWFDIVGRRRVIDKRTTAGARVCVCVCVCGDSRRRCQRFRRHYRPDSGLHHRNRDSSMTADYGTAAEERHPRGSWSAVETCRSLKKNKRTIERDERWGKWKKKDDEKEKRPERRWKTSFYSDSKWEKVWWNLVKA